MAGSIDPADYDAPATYGDGKKMLDALSAYLAAQDPRTARRTRANGSNARGQVGVLRQVVTHDPLLVLKALAEPLKKKRRRQLATERQQRRRDRLRQEAALRRVD